MLRRSIASLSLGLTLLLSSFVASAAPRSAAPAVRVAERAPADTRVSARENARETGRSDDRVRRSADTAKSVQNRATGGKVYGAAPEKFATPAPPAIDAPEQRSSQALGVPKPRPEVFPHAVVLSRQGFVSVFDPDRKVPLVVSWATTPKDLGPSREAWGQREDVFHEDTHLEAPQASLVDYRGSGYHRGHMVRQGERPISINREANQSTFSMVNILPQSKNNNLGPWGHFEDFYRDQVFETKKVAYVQAGPIFEGAPKTIGKGGVAVPSHTYKIVVLADEGVDLRAVRPEQIGTSVKVFAVIIPNNDVEVRQGDHWADYAVPVSQIAKRTTHPGFLSGFADDTRKTAWNHRPTINATTRTEDQRSYVVDGVVAKAWAAKSYNREPSRAAP